MSANARDDRVNQARARLGVEVVRGTRAVAVAQDIVFQAAVVPDGDRARRWRASWVSVSIMRARTKPSQALR
ncbi:hypothetical protein V5738_07685 [Salinisphaera sp. SPP-AMP-43]|uniref:hypothetical protein n=1 Tax=Salinisphaera sp. SPP-AMP-43 TaxID=3121288 RepID=UPI003C6E0901